MSAHTIASFRLLQGQCSRHVTSGLLSLQVQSPTARLSICAIIALTPQQRRHRSTFSRPKGRFVDPDISQGAKDRPKSEKPRMTRLQFISYALRAGFRNLAVVYSPAAVRAAFREAPFQCGLGILVLIILFVSCYVFGSHFIKLFYSPEWDKYPKPIADSLRNAVWHVIAQPDPEKALAFFRQAMQQCAEHGLDPFSDEVLGIRMYIAVWLQRINSFESAVQNLEVLSRDCRKWVEAMEQCVKNGEVDDAGRYRPKSKGNLPMKPQRTGEAKVTEETEETVPDDTETLWAKRQRLLAHAVSINVKLGELYGDEHVMDPDKSHARLVWALETSIKEYQRRKTQETKPGETEWLSPEEFGGTMEALGRDYERKSQFHLAIPLFFQALRLCESPCHRPVIMNNISASFAQHPIYTPPLTDLSDTVRALLDPAMPRTREECLNAALNWASNAYSHANDVKGESRTPECDEACAVALCNWGDVAAMLGKVDLARKKYKECIEMSSKMEFSEGVEQAQKGLAQLTTTPSNRI